MRLMPFGLRSSSRKDQAFAESRWFDALSASGTREDVEVGLPRGCG